MGNQWREWQRGVLGAKQPALVTHSGKTVLHSLELKHVPNCNNMQQGVAVVKPTGHKGRCQAPGLVQVQMFSDSAQVMDMTESLQTLLM